MTLPITRFNLSPYSSNPSTSSRKRKNDSPLTEERPIKRPYQAAIKILSHWSEEPIVSQQRLDAKNSIWIMLGNGDSGRVRYLEDHPQFAVKDAVRKQMRGQVSFENEYRIGKKLDHPFFNKVIGLYKKNQRQKLVMERIHGTTFNCYRANLTKKQIIAFVTQIGEGCQYLFEKKIVWKDIHGDNIYIINNDDLVIGDFERWQQYPEICDDFIFKLFIGTIDFVFQIINKFPRSQDSWTLAFPKNLGDIDYYHFSLGMCRNNFSEPSFKSIMESIANKNTSEEKFDIITDYLQSVLHKIKTLLPDDY